MSQRRCAKVLCSSFTDLLRSHFSFCKSSWPLQLFVGMYVCWETPNRSPVWKRDVRWYHCKDNLCKDRLTILTFNFSSIDWNWVENHYQPSVKCCQVFGCAMYVYVTSHLAGNQPLLGNVSTNNVSFTLVNLPCLPLTCINPKTWRQGVKIDNMHELSVVVYFWRWTLHGQFTWLNHVCMLVRL